MQENFAERQIAAASNHDPGNGIAEICNPICTKKDLGIDRGRAAISFLRKT